MESMSYKESSTYPTIIRPNCANSTMSICTVPTAFVANFFTLNRRAIALRVSKKKLTTQSGS